MFLDAACRGHAANEQHRAKRKAHDDAFGEIAKHRQQKSRQQHHRIAARTAQQRRKLMLLRHVPGHDREDTGQSRQRNVPGQGGGQQHEQKQERRVQHAGDGATRTGAHVGGGAGDRAGDTYATEHCRADIGHALGHQFAVRAVTAAGHAIGNHRGEQRFDRPEQCKGNRVWQHGLRLGEREFRQRRCRQHRRNAAETAGDGFDRQRECPCHDRRRCNGNQHARPVRPDPFQSEDRADCQHGQRQRAHVDGGQGARQHFGLGDDLAGLLACDREPEQVLDLAGEDDDGDAGSEAHRHRIGNELDEGAQAQIARHHEKNAGHGRGQHDAIDAVPIDGRGDQHDEGAGRAADLEAAAAQRRDQETSDDRGEEPTLGWRTRGDGDRHRKRQGHDGHGEAGGYVGAKSSQSVAFAQNRHQLRHKERAEARSIDQGGRGCVDTHLTK